MFSFVMLSTIIIITVIEVMRFLDVKVIANINITMQRCFYPTFVVDLNYTQFDGTAHDINIRAIKLFKDFNNTNYCTDSMAYIIKLDVIYTFC